MGKIRFLLLTISSVILLAGCGQESQQAKKWIDENLEITSSMELDYATGYTVDFTDDGLAVICIDGEDYLLYAEDATLIPENVPDSITTLTGPLKSIYVVGTGSMDFFVKADALDQVKYTSLEADEWSLETVKNAIESGQIVYAGKYSAPDYEMLLSGGTDLIVENTMISHSPEVMEQLKKLGFSCMVDHSSYEASVEGRMEWIKLYGLLTGHFKQAEKAFEESLEPLLTLDGEKDESEKSVCYFSITAAGTVTIRKKDDYICNMIRRAGGTYAFDSLDGIDGTGSTTIQMESFYEIAKDCDVMIYNGTIEGDITSISDLIEKNELLEKCQAVKTGNVYCTTDSLYQSVMELGQITADFGQAVNGGDDIKYLTKLQ